MIKIAKRFISLSIIDTFIIFWFIFIIYCWALSLSNTLSIDLIRLLTYPFSLIITIICFIKTWIILRTNKYYSIKSFDIKQRFVLQPQKFISILLTGIVILLQLVYIIKLPPTNWDSMTYHLTKIALALQYKSMILPSDIPVMRVNSSPWNSEIANLAFFSITSNDLLVELPQFLAALGIIYLLMEYLNTKKKWIIIAFFSVPIFLTQMVTTQNDLVFYFLALYIFCRLIELIKSFSLSKLILIIISSALLIGTKITGIIILGIILAVVLIHYIYQIIIKKKVFKWLGFRILLRAFIVGIILFIFGLVVATPSYLIAKKYYDNYLALPSGFNLDTNKVGFNTFSDNIVHFKRLVFNPSQLSTDIYNHDTGHLGDVFILVVAITIITLVLNKNFRKEIIRDPLVQISCLFLVVFMIIHPPDNWDLRLVLFPFVTLFIIFLNKLNTESEILEKLFLGAVILGVFSTTFGWFLSNLKYFSVYPDKVSISLGEFLYNRRPSIFTLYNNSIFKQTVSSRFLLVGGEDSWVYPYYNNQLKNKIYFNNIYKEENYDFIVVDNYSIKDDPTKGGLIKSIEKCNNFLSGDMFSLIYIKDSSKCKQVSDSI